MLNKIEQLSNKHVILLERAMHYANEKLKKRFLTCRPVMLKQV